MRTAMRAVSRKCDRYDGPDQSAVRLLREVDLSQVINRSKIQRGGRETTSMARLLVACKQIAF